MTAELAVIHPELAQLASARAALEQSRDLAEVKAIRDMAAAMQRYAQAQKLGEDAKRYAQEIVNRAERRYGQIVAATPKQPGPGRGKTFDDDANVSMRSQDYNLSARSQKLAEIPEDVFEANAHKPVTRLARVAREAAAEKRRAQPVEPVTTTPGVEIRHGDFREVLADLRDVDAIITDPPYPREFWALYEDLAVIARRILKPDGILAVMTGTRLEMLDNVDASMGRHMRRRHRGVYLVDGQRWRDQLARVAIGYKPILIYARPDATDLRWINNDVFTSPHTNKADQRFHHWGQSEGGFASIISGLTEPGHLVVDPFLGGGTTAVVCRDLGRRFVGCDIDAAHVTTARERVA